ncbi:restriction endonuclease S subunit, partial [Streptococcus sobrinus DSM 20742 = ATCC 33478]
MLPIGLANYQSFKLAVLSKMFPKNRQNLPEIRLVGFQGGWKERRLKDLVEQVTRKNSAFDLDNVLIISAQYELINQEDFLMITCKNKYNL